VVNLVDDQAAVIARVTRIAHESAGLVAEEIRRALAAAPEHTAPAKPSEHIDIADGMDDEPEQTGPEPMRVFDESTICVMSETEVVMVKGLQRELAVANARIAELSALRAENNSDNRALREKLAAANARADAAERDRDLFSRGLAAVRGERDRAESESAALRAEVAAKCVVITEGNDRIAELERENAMIAGLRGLLVAANARAEAAERKAVLQALRVHSSCDLEAANARTEAAERMNYELEVRRQSVVARAERAESEAASLRAEKTELQSSHERVHRDECGKREALDEQLAAANALLKQCEPWLLGAEVLGPQVLAHLRIRLSGQAPARTESEASALRAEGCGGGGCLSALPYAQWCAACHREYGAELARRGADNGKA